jgi:PAS domain S-box-containing protein
MTDNETKIRIANNRLITAERYYWAADIVALLVVWTIWPYVSHAQALLAGTGLVLANHILSVIGYLFNRDEAPDSRSDFWEKWLITGNLIAGSAWGLTSALLFRLLPQNVTPDLIMISTLLIAAWSIASVPATKCVYAFSLPAGSSLLLAMLLYGSPSDYAISLIIPLFLISILKHTRMVSATYRASTEQLSGLQKLARTEAERGELISQDYARLRHLLDAVPVPVIVSNRASGLLVYLNQAALDLIGIKDLSERPGARGVDFFATPEERDKAIAKIVNNDTTPVEFQLKRADGSLFWAYYTASQMVYEGEPAIIGTVTDVTSRRQAEEDLRNSQEELQRATEQQNSRLRDVLDNVPVPICVSKQEDGVILYMNRSALDLAGVNNLSEIPDSRGMDFIADPVERERLRHRRTTNQYISEKDYKYLEFQLMRRDGSLMWVLYSANEMVYEGQTAIIGAFTDLTVRRQTEAELRQSEEKFRLLADHAHDMISIYSPDSTCLYVSPSVERLFGYSPDEVIGQPVSKFMHPEDLETVISITRSSSKKGEEHPVYLSRWLHKSGHWEWVETTNTLEKDPVTGKITQVFSVSRLVTERVRNEQELREARERAEAADRAKSDFLAHMSHEIRTPLNAVIGFSEIMRDQLFGPLGSERYLEYTNDIYNSGTHLLALINEVLDLSKIEAGKFELQEDRAPLNTIIEATFRFVRERAESKLIALQCSLHAAPDLWCDRRIFTQVMLNIVGNAIKFTPERGRITVESSLDAGGNLILTVTDTGIGIAQEDIPIVMKPFGQARTSSHIGAAEPGTGLGLPLSKSFIEKHQGTLSITSELGIGTRVIIIIPAARVMDDQGDTGVAATAL